MCVCVCVFYPIVIFFCEECVNLILLIIMRLREEKLRARCITYRGILICARDLIYVYRFYKPIEVCNHARIYVSNVD